MQVTDDAFELGKWRVFPTLNRITDQHTCRTLEPRVMRTLVLLASRKGEVLSRSEILDYIWEDVFVSDDSLTRSISDLRKALDDDPRSPTIIETIRAVGYRLVSPVGPLKTAPPDPPGAKDPLQPAPRPSQRLSAFEASRFAAAAVAVVLLALAMAPGASVESENDSSGRQLTPVTTYPGVEKAPAFSPDGARIVFVREDMERRASDLFLKAIGSDDVSRLTQTASLEASPSWSPDGERIAYTRMQQGVCELVIKSLSDGVESSIGDCAGGLGSAVAWSPGGEWIAYTGTNYGWSSGEPTLGLQALFLVSPDSEERRQLTFPVRAEDWFPSFSPDGARVSFVRFSSKGVGDLYSIPVDGGEAVRLTRENSLIIGQTWTQDGRSLVYSSNKAGGRSLWKIPATGGVGERIPWVGTTLPTSPVFLSHSNQLAFVDWAVDRNIWRLDLGPNGAGGPAPRPFVNSTRSDRFPSVSPNGERVAFISNRSGTTEVWVRTQGEIQEVRLTDFSGGFVSLPRWSPDGKSLVVEVRQRSHADLYLVDAESGESRRLTYHQGDDVAASWGAEGTSIYFGSDRTGEWQVWKMSIDDGNAEQITVSGGYTGFEAPTGGAFYYVKRHEPGIWLLSPDEADVQIVPGLDCSDWGNWALADGALYYLNRAAARPPHLMKFDLSLREETRLSVLPENLSSGGAEIAFFPDQASMLITSVDRWEGDIVVLSSVL